VVVLGRTRGVAYRLLDLFCGAGGCAVGYHRAGFTDIVGVDLKPQPRYPFAFVQGDALEYLAEHGREFDAIHASPPCQAYTSMRSLGKGAGKNAPDLVGPTRDLLEASSRPWVIENVPGAPLFNAVMLCGSMFGLRVRRHRLFESSFFMLGITSCEHKPGALAVYGDHPEDAFLHAKSMPQGSVKRAPTIDAARLAMGIDWMVWKEITQAIPPAYTEFIGKQLLSHLES
jgi:DNA (cytosine-5)-methyltransferase 1